MRKANEEIRKEAETKNVRLWEIAKKMGYSYSWIIQKIRIELSKEEKIEMLAVIDAIAKEREDGKN